jgi:hypothetical protein
MNVGEVTWRAMEAHFASAGFVPSIARQEPVQQHVAVTVHVCPPTEARPFVAMYTTGMSDRPMAVDQPEDFAHAELAVFLPAKWQTASDSPLWSWPADTLSLLARFPHEHGSWFGPGHHVPLPQELPGTQFSAIALLPTISVPSLLRASDGRQVCILTVFPLYSEELELKRRDGTEAFVDRLIEAGLSDLADPTRPNVG